MAHDVLIAGALFPDVPSVQFPDSQQQWHSFTDVSDTTAAASDVAQGKVFYDAQGTLTQGTASGGGGLDADFKAVVERGATPASVTLPSDVTRIGDYAFYNFPFLESVKCDGAITALGNLEFANCPRLTSIEFPHMALSSIGAGRIGSSNSSQACQALEVADVGITQAIGSNAFANCYKLQTLVLRRSDAICTLSNVSGFYNTPMRGYNGLSGTVYVPRALIDMYKAANNWKTIYDAGYLTFAAIEGSEWEL